MSSMEGQLDSLKASDSSLKYNVALKLFAYTNFCNLL